MSETVTKTGPVRESGFLCGGRLDELLTARIRRADIFLSSAFHQVTAAHQLKSGAISSLALIIANPGISQNELASQVRTDKSRIVSIVDALEQGGLAKRVQSSVDRRRRALHATPRGHALLDGLIAEVKAAEQRLLSMVPAEDLEALDAILGRILHSCTTGVLELGDLEGLHSNMPYV